MPINEIVVRIYRFFYDSTIAWYLFGGGRAVIHQHQRGEDVCRQTNDGDEVGCDPGRHPVHQPLPVALHDGFEQRASRAAVAMLLQTLQLVARQNRRRQLEQTSQCTGCEPTRRIHAPCPLADHNPAPPPPTHHSQPITARV